MTEPILRNVLSALFLLTVFLSPKSITLYILVFPLAGVPNAHFHPAIQLSSFAIVLELLFVLLVSKTMLVPEGDEDLYGTS